MYYDKTLYHERLKAGVCVYCGINKPDIGPDGKLKSACKECREIQNAYKRKSRAKKRGEQVVETDPVELSKKKVPCKACRVSINALYYYCPWCGANQNNDA